MAINFPSSPNATDTHTEAGITWVYDGDKWTTVGDSGGDANHHDGPTAPLTGSLGDQWYNTDDGRLYTYTTDSSGDLVWIDASPDTIGGDGGSGGGDVINYSGAAAWGTFDGSSPNGLKPLLGGLNIASVERQSTGSYVITFINPMPDNNYSVTATGAPGVFKVNKDNKTTTSFVMGSNGVASNAGNAVDSHSINFVVHALNALPPKGGTGTDCWGTVDKTEVNGPCNVPASFNVASVTRTDVGKYDVVFTTPMPSANYAIATSGDGSNVTVGGYDAGPNGFTIHIYVSAAPISTAGFVDCAFNFTVNATNATLPSTITQEEVDLILDAIKNGISGTGTSSWGYIDENGDLVAGLNCTVVKTGKSGERQVTFDTPMSNANYSVTTGLDFEWTGSSSTAFVSTYNHTANGFTLRSKRGAEFNDNIPASFAVHASDVALPFTVTHTQIQNVISRLDAIEANEQIDDATDTSLLQLVANASTRLDSIEARLSTLESGN